MCVVKRHLFKTVDVDEGDSNSNIHGLVWILKTNDCMQYTYIAHQNTDSDQVELMWLQNNFVWFDLYLPLNIFKIFFSEPSWERFSYRSPWEYGSWRWTGELLTFDELWLQLQCNTWLWHGLGSDHHQRKEEHFLFQNWEKTSRGHKLS